MSATRAGRVDAARRRVLGALLLAPFAGGARARAGRAAARIVVLGGGFGGATCARALRRLDAALDVTVVDAAPRYATGPMSNAVLAGWRTLDAITVDRAGLARDGVRVVTARAASLDAAHRVLRLAGGAELAYDRLVVAPGIRLLWNSPDGYDAAAAERMPHAWLPGAQTALLARQLRALDDGGVVAISVPAGLIRCPPGPYERASIVAAWLQRNRPRAKVLILDANNHFPRQEMFLDAWKTLYGARIEWIPSTEGGAVERVDAARMTLHAVRGAQRVGVANVIPRQAAGQFALDAGLASGHGWCPVHAATLASTLVPDVHVIGDACAAGAMPKAASAAQAQALQCARAIVSALHDAPPPAPELDSVCYSFLARDRALAIHARFGADGDEIRSQPLPSPTRAPSPSEEAQLAERWYRGAVADAFGAG